MAAARTRLRRRMAWIGLAAATGTIVLLVGFVGWTLNPASLQPRLIEAAWRATGRTLTISGDVGIKLSFAPTVTMDDVTLSNPPGFSRPEMIKLARVELGLALVPLLRHHFEVDHVTLVRPDVLLETDTAGHGNWVFTQGPRQAPGPVAVPEPLATAARMASSASPGSVPVQPPPGGTAKRRFDVSFKDAGLVDGQIGWIDGRSGHRYTVSAPRLTLDAPAGGPVDLRGSLVFERHTIALTAHAVPPGTPGEGPGVASTPWPLTFKLESDGATVTADGQIARPLQGRGYSLTVDADVPDPGVFAPLFPRLPLAALKAVTAHADVSDSGRAIPTVSSPRVTVGSIDLDRFRPGARLEDVTLTVQSQEPMGPAPVGPEPIRVAARLTTDGFDSGISGNIGDLPWLMAGASGPVAVNLEWNAASARASVRGTIQTPSRFGGVALDVAASVPDPSLVTNDAPAALKAVLFRARLTDAGPIPFQLSSSAGDLTGALTVARSPASSTAQVSVEGQVWSNHIDLDLLRGAASARPGAGAGVAIGPAGAAAPVLTGPASTRGAGGSAASGPSASGSAATGSGGGGASGAASASPGPRPASSAATSAKAGPLIPDTRLPFGVVRAVDGNVSFNFAHVQVDGADIRKITGVVAVKDGVLRLDPFTIAAPDQRVSGVLVADAAATPPTVHLTVEAPGLALWGLLGALGLPPAATGAVAVRADLSGTGDSPRAIAASLDGWAGMAVEGGQIDAKMVNAWLGQFQPLHIGGGDVTDLRCLAMRADAKSGVLTIKPLALNTPSLIVDGDGDVDLRNETLALRLRPRAKIGGTGIALPVRVSGPMRAPSARIDISTGGPGGGMLAGLLLGGGKDVMGAAGGGDPCPAALAQARAGGSREGAAASGAAGEAPPPASDAKP